jgi:hypothetical protein
MLEIENRLYPLKVRFGIGWGSISTEIGKTTAEMDGECFHRSRQALEMAKRLDRNTIFQTGDDALDKTVDAILFLLNSIKADWEDIHYQRIRRYEETGSQEMVAKAEGVSQQAISKTLKSCKYEAVKAGQEAIDALLQSR